VYLRTSPNFRVSVTEIDCAEKLLVYLRTSPDFKVSVTEIVGRPTRVRLLLLRILDLWWGSQTYVALDNCETKRSQCFSLKCEHALVKKQSFQLISATYIHFFGWKTICLLGKKSMLMKYSHNHKQDFGCQHFVSKQAFRGNAGSNQKIEENHSKCINLTRVSVSS